MGTAIDLGLFKKLESVDGGSNRGKSSAQLAGGTDAGVGLISRSFCIGQDIYEAMYDAYELTQKVPRRNKHGHRTRFR